MKSDEKFELCKKETKKALEGLPDNLHTYYWELVKKCFLINISKETALKLIKEEADQKFHELIDILVNKIYSIKINKPKTNYHRIVKFLRNRYDFRYNEVTKMTEFKKKDEVEYKDVETYHLNSFHHELKSEPIPVHQTIIPAIINSSFAEPYNPFKEYFSKLPEWDKVDHIGQMADTVKTNNDDLWKRAFKKWIVATVGSAIDDHIINQTLIVFTSKQGLGKTTWMEKLLPEPLRKYYFSGVIDPRNKDTLIHLSECLFVNLDELENLNRNEIGELKQIITLSKIRLRRPYGRVPETLVRRGSLMGSVNTLEFLNDPTGSRRFLAFETLAIDYQHKIDINKVYSQALHLYKNGYKYYFDQVEIEEINQHNEQFQYKPIEEEMLLEHFEPCTKEEADFFGNATRVLELLSERDPAFTYNNGHKMSMGKLLTKHKFLKIKKKSLYVYALRERIKPINASINEDEDKKGKIKSAYDMLLQEMDDKEIENRLKKLSPLVYKLIVKKLKDGLIQPVPFENFCSIIEKHGKTKLDDYDRGVLLRIAKDEHIVLLPDEFILVPREIDDVVIEDLF